MKKQSILLLLLMSSIILASCSDSDNQSKTHETNALACSQDLVVSGGSGQSLNLKAKVVANNTKTILSSNGGNIEYLDCEKGKRVAENTLIAKIKPDSSDPNTQNLVNQLNMMNVQIGNTRDIITSTKANFDTQLNSLMVQKANTENQLKIANDSYAKISEQKDFGVLDIDKQLDVLNIQIQTLDIQISDLTASKTKLESSKKADLEKIQLNLVNTKTQSKSLAGSILFQIDQIFGFSTENKSKNDDYETYLGAKNTALKNGVEHEWYVLNEKHQKFSTLSESEISEYLQSVNNLVIQAKEAINNSVSSAVFQQSSIDNFYNLFSQYESNVVTAKNGLDNIIKSTDTVSNGYDTQILSIDTQINGAKNSKKSVESSISNIKSNKLGTYTTSIDIQKNQAEAQIETLKGGLSSINSQIDALKSQREIQLNQLNNQVSQLQSSQNTININLAGQSLFAQTSGIIKEKSVSIGNKIAGNAVICQILPDASSLGIQVYTSYNLSLPLDIKITADGKEYSTKIITKLPYQDSATQNYVYETSNTLTLDGKNVNIADVFSEGKNIDITTAQTKDKTTGKTLSIPIDFVSNTIAGSKVKVKSESGTISEKNVVLGSLDANNVEIRSGIQAGETICN